MSGGYLHAASLAEALAYLSSHRGEAQVVAWADPGRMEAKAVAAAYVDISGIAELKRIHLEGEHLLVGGAVTFLDLRRSALVRHWAPLLHEAAQLTRSPDAHRVPTLAGKLVGGDVLSEGVVSLVALDGEVEITNLTGRQWLPAASLIVRDGVSRVDSGAEIVTAVRVPVLGARRGAALERLAAHSSAHRPRLVLAVMLSLGEGREPHVQVAVGTPRRAPTRLMEVEDALQGPLLGRASTAQVFGAAVATALREAGEMEGSDGLDARVVGRAAADAYARALSAALAREHLALAVGH